jgi:hypothetical protein
MEIFSLFRFEKASITMITILYVLVYYHLIQLHGPNGQAIDINPHAVSSLRDSSVVSEGHLAKGTKCLLFMSNGKTIGVSESCEEVKPMVEEAQ